MQCEDSVRANFVGTRNVLGASTQPFMLSLACIESPTLCSVRTCGVAVKRHGSFRDFSDQQAELLREFSREEAIKFGSDKPSEIHCGIFQELESPGE